MTISIPCLDHHALALTEPALALTEPALALTEPALALTDRSDAVARPAGPGIGCGTPARAADAAPPRGTDKLRRIGRQVWHGDDDAIRARRRQRQHAA